MIEEIWKDIIGFEGSYMISSLGRVKSLNYNKTKKEKILKPQLDKQGYYTIGLCKNKKKKHYKIHRLVCQTFLHNPEKKKQVNHKNGIKNDNILENLEYMTAKENNIHKYKVLGYKGIIDKTIYTFFNKELNIIEISTQSELRKKYKLHKGNISSMVNGKVKSVKSWTIIKQ